MGCTTCDTCETRGAAPHPWRGTDRPSYAPEGCTGGIIRWGTWRRWPRVLGWKWKRAGVFGLGWCSCSFGDKGARREVVGE
eukprot:scaffold15726_cov79-Isochrysis_galbana.AAC.1